jgi:hypothetical protein
MHHEVRKQLKTFFITPSIYLLLNKMTMSLDGLQGE